MLVYDTEILKAIPDKSGYREEGIDYCDGWDDFENMGITCLTAYDYDQERYRIYCQDNLKEFVALAEKSRPVISFNGWGFDDRLLQANDLSVTTDYDLLAEMWWANGLDPHTFDPSTHTGYGLDVTAVANNLDGKIGHEAQAPIQWQRGQYGDVINYCLDDTILLKKLIDLVLLHGCLVNPKDASSFINLPRPYA